MWSRQWVCHIPDGLTARLRDLMLAAMPSSGASMHIHLIGCTCVSIIKARSISHEPIVHALIWPSALVYTTDDMPPPHTHTLDYTN